MSKYLLMLWIFRIFRIAALYLVLMCSLKLSCESRYPPRYLTIKHLSIVLWMTLIIFSLLFVKCCPLPKYINFVLDSFSLSLTVLIHALTSSGEDSRIAIVSCSCLVPDLNYLCMGWSSANPFRVRSSLMTSQIVEAFAMKMKAPCIDPWGMLNIIYLW